MPFKFIQPYTSIQPVVWHDRDYV